MTYCKSSSFDKSLTQRLSIRKAIALTGLFCLLVATNSIKANAQDANDESYPILGTWESHLMWEPSGSPDRAIVRFEARLIPRDGEDDLLKFDFYERARSTDVSLTHYSRNMPTRLSTPYYVGRGVRNIRVRYPNGSSGIQRVHLGYWVRIQGPDMISVEYRWMDEEDKVQTSTVQLSRLVRQRLAAWQFPINLGPCMTRPFFFEQPKRSGKKKAVKKSKIRLIFG